MALVFGLLTKSDSRAVVAAVGCTFSMAVMLWLCADTPTNPGFKLRSWGSFQVAMPVPPAGGDWRGPRSVKIWASWVTVNSRFPGVHHVAAVSVEPCPHSTTEAMATGLAAKGTYANDRPFL